MENLLAFFQSVFGEDVTMNDVYGFFATVILSLIVAIALGGMFRKAGRSFFAAFVPVYNIYVLYAIVWNKKAFWRDILWGVLFVLGCIMIALPLLILMISWDINGITGEQIVADLLDVFAEDILFTVFVAMYLFGGIASAVDHLRLCFKTAVAFGKKKSFGWVLLLFAPIAIIALGFGKSQYVGPAVKKKKEKIVALDEADAEIAAE